MERHFPLDEIKESVFSLQADKAWAAMVLPWFLPKMLKTIKKDLAVVFRDFLSNGKITKGTNSILICVFLKK